MLTCQERRAKVGIFCNNQAALVKGRLSNDIFGYDPKLRPVELHISIPATGLSQNSMTIRRATLIQALTSFVSYRMRWPGLHILRGIAVRISLILPHEISRSSGAPDCPLTVLPSLWRTSHPARLPPIRLSLPSRQKGHVTQSPTVTAFSPSLGPTQADRQ